MRGRTVREGTGDLLLPAGFTESPANSLTQDLTVASLCKKYNAQASPSFDIATTTDSNPKWFWR